MPSKYALSVSLTEHLCQFVDRQVASGRYRTASEVVREALRLLETQLSNPLANDIRAAGPTDVTAVADAGHVDGNPHARTERRVL